LNILVATSEAVPFAKTGGLADVCGALPVELARLGHKPAVILPNYRQCRRAGPPIAPTGLDLSIPIGTKTVRGRLLQSTLPGSRVPVYLVEQDGYFDRPALYGENGQDYIDNCERFVFFCRAVLDAIRLLDLRPEVVHCNDWQTGLIPAYCHAQRAGLSGNGGVATLFTIHNMAFQGQFWHWDMLLTGLDWKYFNWRQMEFFGHLNLMKTGLVFADALNTVSPRYAQEIQTPAFGCGLEGVLQFRRDVLSGIINGVDDREWEPSTDGHLPRKYDAKSVEAGKAACKASLQQELGLAAAPRTPLVAFIGRLTEQKGLDLIAEVLNKGIDAEQWVILGTGEPKYQDLLARLAAANPGKVALRLEFSNPLAHRIEAGADIFVMPSRFEPCGLNQLYSLKYGTVPLVRATGGLADTITDATEENLAAGTATGFTVGEHSAQALAAGLKRACEAYRRPELWRAIVAAGMRQDWSWGRSAREYAALYERTLARAQEALYA
jgi:starch synthase